jgi:hypothetical protein
MISAVSSSILSGDVLGRQHQPLRPLAQMGQQLPERSRQHTLAPHRSVLDRKKDLQVGLSIDTPVASPMGAYMCPTSLNGSGQLAFNVFIHTYVP